MHSKTANPQIVLAYFNILQLQKLDEPEFLEVEDSCMKNNCTVSIGKSIQNPEENPGFDLHLGHPFVCVFICSQQTCKIKILVIGNHGFGVYFRQHHPVVEFPSPDSPWWRPSCVSGPCSRDGHASGSISRRRGVEIIPQTRCVLLTHSPPTY